MSLFQMLFGNLIGLDGLIILVILSNVFGVAYMVRRMSLATERQLKSVVYKPLEEILANLVPEAKPDKALDIHQLRAQREKEDTYFQLFLSVTTILPLMGILGTVLSLLSINALEQAVISLNFTTALSSTFWGITGAIICRVIEGTLAPVIQRNRENYDLLVGKLRQD